MTLGPLMIGIEGNALSPEERQWLLDPLACGVILFTRNFEDRAQLTALVDDIHALRSPPLLVAVDQEGGRVQRFREPFTRLPSMRELGRLYDSNRRAAVDAARSIGWLMAVELRSCGVDLSFAPVVDIDRGLAAVIGDRAFHHSAAAVAALAAAFVAGMQRAGMAATAKHFPTHAGALLDSHAELATDSRDYAELIDDLEPYRKLISAGLPSIMVGHVVFPALDPVPASLSSWWIKTQLREDFGFTGVVISDDLGMGGVAGMGTMAERAKRALAAGCDMLLLCNEPHAVAEVLSALRGYSDPAAQLRLMRLRGGPAPAWAELQAGEQWRHARNVLDSISAPPELQLEG
jgi:beta-N-acetylhexosaminidase